MDSSARVSCGFLPAQLWSSFWRSPLPSKRVSGSSQISQWLSRLQTRQRARGHDFRDHGPLARDQPPPALASSRLHAVTSISGIKCGRGTSPTAKRCNSRPQPPAPARPFPHSAGSRIGRITRGPRSSRPARKTHQMISRCPHFAPDVKMSPGRTRMANHEMFVNASMIGSSEAVDESGSSRSPIPVSCYPSGRASPRPPGGDLSMTELA